MHKCLLSANSLPTEKLSISHTGLKSVAFDNRWETANNNGIAVQLYLMKVDEMRFGNFISRNSNSE